MNKVHKISLNNFKFFLGENTLEVDSKNLIIYGENGSGKSSIYWALFTFLHSTFKTNDLDVRKYFDPANDENLINRYAATGSESAIVVDFVDEHRTITTKTLSFTTRNTRNGPLVIEAANTSDFINYRILSRLYDFSNREQIDLFSLFEKEVLMFINFPIELSPGVTSAAEWWDYLKKGLNPRPNINTDEYRDFQNKMHVFNEELNTYLLSILQTANDYLHDKFRQNLKINFTYHKGSYDDFIPGSTTKRTHRSIAPQIILNVELLHSQPHAYNLHLRRPQSFLNEARLTAIALSIRFAVIDAKYIAAATKILVFDDLLISLDMSNRDIVLEIILSTFPDYQIILLTHDRMFFELATHKAKHIAAEQWLSYEMFESEKNGILQPYIKKSSSYLDKAKANFYQKEYEMTGNFLRKQAEHFCKSFLPKRYQFNEDLAPLNLDNLIQQCIQFGKAGGLVTLLFEELNNHRKFVLNPSSHDSHSIAKFSYEIEKCIATFDALERLTYDHRIKAGETFSLVLIDSHGIDYSWEIILEEDAILMMLPGYPSCLGPVKFGHKMFRAGAMIHDWEYSRTTIASFYAKWYERSNKAKTDVFWDEFIHLPTGNLMRTLRLY